jgi:SAM-dependent methyltransferase
MHRDAYQFVAGVVHGKSLADATVLEIGSMNVNGSVRDLFAAEYIGIDREPGPGVDYVFDAAHFDGAQTFDVVVSTEALEHALDPAAIIGCAWRALEPGGMLVVTAATPQRAPHSCNGGPLRQGEHYEGIDEKRLRAMLRDWRLVRVQFGRGGRDIYATAIKPEDKEAPCDQS